MQTPGSQADSARKPLRLRHVPRSAACPRLLAAAVVAAKLKAIAATTRRSRKRDGRAPRIIGFAFAERLAARDFLKLRLLRAAVCGGTACATEFSRRRPRRARSGHGRKAGAGASARGQDAHRRASPLRVAGAR